MVRICDCGCSEVFEVLIAIAESAKRGRKTSNAASWGQLEQFHAYRWREEGVERGNECIGRPVSWATGGVAGAGAEERAASGSAFGRAMQNGCKMDADCSGRVASKLTGGLLQLLTTVGGA